MVRRPEVFERSTTMRGYSQTIHHLVVKMVLLRWNRITKTCNAILSHIPDLDQSWYASRSKSGTKNMWEKRKFRCYASDRVIFRFVSVRNAEGKGGGGSINSPLQTWAREFPRLVCEKCVLLEVRLGTRARLDMCACWAFGHKTVYHVVVWCDTVSMEHFRALAHHQLCILVRAQVGAFPVYVCTCGCSNMGGR